MCAPCNGNCNQGRACPARSVGPRHVRARRPAPPPFLQFVRELLRRWSRPPAQRA